MVLPKVRLPCLSTSVDNKFVQLSHPVCSPSEELIAATRALANTLLGHR